MVSSPRQNAACDAKEGKGYMYAEVPSPGVWSADLCNDMM